MEIHLFLKKVIFFILFSIFLYPVGVIVYVEFFPEYFQNNIFYEKFANGFSNTRYKEVKQINEVDILFLGSSRTYRHYDPRNFAKEGFTSFNLGSSAQTFIQTEILVKRYLDSLSPKYVILDIYPGMFSSDGAESSFDLISNDFNNWDTFKLAIKTKNIKVFNTWVYALYKEYFFNALNDREKLTKKNDQYIPNGYVERKVSFNRVQGDFEQNWVYNDIQWNSFVEIIEMIRKTKSDLIIVHSPRHSGYKYNNEDKLINYLESQSIPFYNYKDLNFINDTLHFYDPSHLNQNGVDLYNQLILQKHF